MTSVTIDDTRLNAAMDGLYNALVGDGKDVTNLLVSEHRKLARTIANFTPPSPPVSGSRQRGEEAVKADLYSLISEATPELLDKVSASYGVKDISGTYVTTKDIGRTELVWDNIVRDVSQLPEIHNTYRDTKGRVPRRKSVQGQWRARVIVPIGMREEYVRQVQAHVGRWKAKWAVSAFLLGDTKWPKWISQHFDYVKSHVTFEPHLGGDTSQWITFGGRGPNFRANVHHIQGAVKLRVRAIRDRIKIIISGYAKDVAQGVRARTRAHETDGTDEAVE